MITKLDKINEEMLKNFKQINSELMKINSEQLKSIKLPINIAFLDAIKKLNTEQFKVGDLLSPFYKAIYKMHWVNSKKLLTFIVDNFEPSCKNSSSVLQKVQRIDSDE